MHRIDRIFSVIKSAPALITKAEIAEKLGLTVAGTNACVQELVREGSIAGVRSDEKQKRRGYPPMKYYAKAECRTIAKPKKDRYPASTAIRVLQFLHKNPWSRTREISDALAIPEPKVSSIVKRLSDANILVREKDDVYIKNSVGIKQFVKVYIYNIGEIKQNAKQRTA